MKSLSSRELRIGNWVHNPVQNINFQVGGSTIAIEHSRELILKDHKGFEPIPLTEEWLLKFGFNKKGFDMKLKGFKLTASTRIIKEDRLGAFHYKGTGSIGTVHQLQNLYFALTNEELTIKQ